ncbi:MAG: putative glycoside hydrolase [Elusimicrobiota bacterium]|jgi:hypothetical protein|nr:putative glycoside hydrolase [Elusimicrobiota bacterium]
MNLSVIKLLVSYIFASFFVLNSYASSVNQKTKILETPDGEEQVLEKLSHDSLSGMEVVDNEITARYIRGIHLSAYSVSSRHYWNKFFDIFDTTELNAAVIDIKDESAVFIDAKAAKDKKTYTNRIPDLEHLVSQLKKRKVYTIARIVAFRDDLVVKSTPDFAVKNPDGTIWRDRQNVSWLDPYNEQVWEYVLDIAERAVDIGFDEIQFDYIRFPSDGSIRNCRYSKPYNSDLASEALVGFLKEANNRLKSKGANISIDVFGLTTTETSDMGIGQRITEMTKWVDFVSPMVYPSHYRKWAYGIADPNKSPYKTVYYALHGGVQRLPAEKFRPWLQDFSLGHKYKKEEVRQQIQACYDNRISSWLLWNARCVYTKEALKGQDEEYSYEASEPTIAENII